MQNRNAIKIFAILFALICLYQLSFTWVADGVQDDALEYANNYVNENSEQLISDLRSSSNDSLLDSILINEYFESEKAK
ncbi:MAG: hypothetical protein QF864_05065, partial [SAR202 cluster bacterium]|nr:hypothetical protein [SAR202 cluster bacterium]